MEMKHVGSFTNTTPMSPKTTGLSEKQRIHDFNDAFIRTSPDEEHHLRNGLESLLGTRANLTEEPKMKQYADSYGKITHMCLMLSDSYAGGGTMRKQILDAYKTLFTKMEPETKFSIVVNSDRDRRDVEKVISDNNIQNPERIKFVKTDKPGLTVWARDMMICGYNPEDSSSAVLQPSPLHYWHGSDGSVPPQLVKANPHITLIDEPRIVTDGGDVMANTKNSFVGYYSLAATANKLSKMVQRDASLKDRIVHFYENRMGKEVVRAENEDAVFPYKFEMTPYPKEIHRFNFTMVNNPDYKEPALRSNQISEAAMYEDLAEQLYADKFGKPVTVLGKDDPATPHKEEPASDHLDMGATAVDDNTCFVGDPTLVKKAFAKMSPERLREVEDHISEIVGRPIDIEHWVESGRNRDNPEDFNAYAKTLTGQGYNVVRVPHSEPKWGAPYISYNNCVMERFEKDGAEFRRVFLPVYGIKELDDMAVQAYKDQGFEVHPMKLDALSTRWGALRCISNWLERTPQG